MMASFKKKMVINGRLADDGDGEEEEDRDLPIRYRYRKKKKHFRHFFCSLFGNLQSFAASKYSNRTVIVPRSYLDMFMVQPLSAGTLSRKLVLGQLACH